MKKTLSAILCFVLLLSFMPTLAMADGEPLPLYAQIGPDAYGTTISAPAGGGKGVALCIDSEGTSRTDAGYTYGITGNSMGSVSWDGQSGVLNWDTRGAVPGASGTITATKDNVTYSLSASVGMAAVGVYTDSYDSENIGANYLAATDNTYNIEYTAGTVKTAYLVIGSGFNWTFESPASSNGAVGVEASQDGKMLTVTLPSTASGVVSTVLSFTAGDNNLTRTINFSDGSWDGAQITTDDVYVGSTANEDMGPVPFTYDGATYYIGVGWWTNERLSAEPNDTSSNPSGMDVTMRRIKTIGIWTKNEDGYTQVSGDLAATLFGLFENCELKVYASDMRSGCKMPDKRASSESGLDVEYQYLFDDGAWGTYVFEMSATLKSTGDVYKAKVKSTHEVMWQINKPVESIEAANTYLASLVENSDATYTYNVILPAQALTGQIVVPSGIEGLVTITGSESESQQGVRTGITGGVTVNNERTILNNIDFTGTGKTAETRGDGVTSNVGISGIGLAGFNGCTFSGYWHAVESLDNEGIRFGGSYTAFYDNNVGIYLDTGVQNGGNLQMTAFEFSGNNIGIEIVRFTQYIPISEYFIFRSRFIDNGIDIKLHGERSFFIPGNYFDHGGTKAPVFEGNVFAAPWYLTFTPQNFEINYGLSDLYWPAASTVSSTLASQYPILVEDVDGKSITVVNNSGASDMTLGTVSFPEAASLLSHGGLLDLGVKPKFDPTLAVTRTDSAVSITVNAAPEGKTPALTVPCEGWYGASVSYNGADVESTFAGESVSFAFTEGGTYEITRLYAPYVPSEPAAPDSKTTTSTVIGEDGSITETTTTKNSDGSSVTVIQTTAPGGGETAAAEISAAPKAKSAEVPPDVLETLSGVSDGTLTVKTDSAELVFDSAAIAALKETGKEIKITAAAADRNELSAAQLSLIGDAPVIELNVNGDSADFGGGAVTVSVAYELKEGESADGMVVWFLGANGKLSECECAYENGVLTFKTKHFSKYVIAYFPFADAESGAWYYEDIVYAFNNDLFKGSSDDAFDPCGTMTRQMVWTVLARMDGQTPADYAQAREWAVANGISDGTYPEGAVTRQELAVLIYRCEQLKGGGFTGSWMLLLPYSDIANIADWAYEGMAWCHMNGIVNGVGNDMADPRGDATRAQVAAMLRRLCEVAK